MPELVTVPSKIRLIPTKPPVVMPKKLEQIMMTTASPVEEPVSPEELLTAAQVRKQFGISKHYLKRLQKDGLLEPVQIAVWKNGKSLLRYRASDVRKLRKAAGLE